MAAGNVTYINVASQDMVFLNSVEDAVNLLEKRSSKYSDRIHSSMIKLYAM